MKTNERPPLDELFFLVEYHSHRHYCLDNPAISDYDYDYDLLFDELRSRWEDYPLFSRVGSGICEDLHKKGEK